MKSFCELVDKVEREGESVVRAVRKEGEVMFERLEPMAGEGMRGVAYCEAVGERREDGLWVRVEGVVGPEEGEIGDLGASARGSKNLMREVTYSLISKGPRVERRGSAKHRVESDYVQKYLQLTTEQCESDDDNNHDE